MLLTAGATNILRDRVGDKPDESCPAATLNFSQKSRPFRDFEAMGKCDLCIGH
jgi:hypothetical protein